MKKRSFEMFFCESFFMEEEMIEKILLGLGLSMDASAVSMTNGMNQPKMKIKKIIFIAFIFGLFQGVMPLLGYFAGSVFVNILASVTPWIALILLVAIGGKMIYDGIKKESTENRNMITIKSVLIQGVATSIDALAVGLVFIGKNVQYAINTAIIIMVVTFAVSLISILIGKKFGTIFENKAQVFGGIILVIIGLKIFIEYLITIL